MNKITFVTPCIRPKNLTVIAESIEAFVPRQYYDWIVVCDGLTVKKEVKCEFAKIYKYTKEGSLYGNAQRNYAIDIIQGNDKYKDTYVYFIDDNTILHKNLWSLVKNATEDMIVFEQIYKNGKTRIGLNNISEGITDYGTAVFKTNAIGTTRLKENSKQAYSYFCNEIASKQISISHINKPASIYKALS